MNDTLTAVTEQRDDFKKELEIANLRLKGKRHPDDNGIMADGELNVKALLEQRDKLAELSGFGEFDKPTELTAAREELAEMEDCIDNWMQEAMKFKKQRDRLAEALRKAISWGDSASHHILHRQDINWTYLNEAREALQSLDQTTEL